MPKKVVCSFLPTKENEGEKTIDAFATVEKALGTALSAIDSAPLKFYTIEMTDFCGSQILSALLMHYKSQLASELSH